MKKTFAMITAAILMCCLHVSAASDLPLFGQVARTPWTAKYMLTDYQASIDENWTEIDFDDSEWQELTGPVANRDYNNIYYETTWEKDYTAYWLRRHFTLTEIPEALDIVTLCDDNCNIYLNGHLIYQRTGASSYTYSMSLSAEMLGYLKIGDNVLSAKAVAYSGQNYFDFGFISHAAQEQALENNALTERSQPIEFHTTEYLGWYADGNTIRSNNLGVYNTESCLYATVDVTIPSRLSFDYKNSNDYNEAFIFYIDNHPYFWEPLSSNASGNISVVLTPGEHKLEWAYRNGDYRNSYIQISNIELISNWATITTETNGQVGKQAIYQFDRLDNPDLNFLKIVGPIGAAEQDDWNDIRNMKNLAGLDLSEAVFVTVPENAFKDLSKLSYVVLPDGIEAIGDYAFLGTQLFDVDIPSSVTSIGREAFKGTKMQHVNFKADSQLAFIGYEAFRDCSFLLDFFMPNTVTSIGLYYDTSSAFYGCTRLERISVSDGLKTLPNYMFYNCNSLQEVKLPANLEKIDEYVFKGTSSLREIEFPETLRKIGGYAFHQSGLQQIVIPVKVNSIGSYAFYDCKSLKYIELPSYIERYYQTMYGCNALETVVCKSPTPPVIESDPFVYGTDRGNMTLYVPEFALADYKLDNYWQKFGQILPIDVTLDYWRISGRLDLTNDHRMQGHPDVDLYHGGKLSVTGASDEDFGFFQYFAGEDNPGTLINRCEALSADSVNTVFPVARNRWYFFSPLYDVNVSDITHSDPSASMAIRYYNAETRATEGKGGWQNVTAEQLHPGIGYILHTNKDGSICLPSAGTHAVMFETEAKATMLETNESENPAHKNWNFVGNPFPCYFDIYYLDFTAPITIWDGRNFVAKSITDDAYALRPMQAFFVQKPDEIQNIVFAVNGRLHTATVGSHNAPARKPAASQRSIFDITVESAGLTDQTRVVLNEQRSKAYEIECDASKFMSLDAEMPQIFTVNDGTSLAINERPQLDGNVELGLKFGTKGQYTISASRADGEVSLYDSLTGVTTDLRVAQYTVNVDEPCEISGRFYLNVCASASSITGIDGDTPAEVSAADGAIAIQGSGAVAVYSLSGIKVYDGTLSAGVNNIPVESGVYVVRINDVTYKVMVK